MNQWRKGIATWTIKDTVYLSVPFTWLVEDAIGMILDSKKKAIVGGPGAWLMRDRFEGTAEVRETGEPFEPVIHHNPLATFTTRGCPNRCSFCAVPQIEGDFREVPDFIPRPIVCDNNFLFSSTKHFNHVIDKLKCLPYVDFNQGLDASLFTPARATRLAELKHVKIRFALDYAGEECIVVDAIGRARSAGLKNLGCYVLIGFNDTPEDALHRLELIKALDIWPNPMRYQPLNLTEKNSYVGKNWTGEQLRRYMKYWSRLRWLEHIPFEDFRPDVEAQEVFDFE